MPGGRQRKLIAIYRSLTKFPVTLHRCQTGLTVKLRARHVQADQRFRGHYDLVVDGKGRVRVHDPTDRLFHGPNGMSLRPKTDTYREILTYLTGDTIFVIPQGTVIPASLQLLYEHSDHYSLQAAKECTYEELNKNLTEFLSKMEKMSKDEFLDTYEY